MNEQLNESAPQRRPGMRGLLALNGALLIILAAVTFGATVNGQARGRGEYTMVSGGVLGSTPPAVWIVDTANQEMIAMMYNPNTKGMEGIGYRNLAADAAAVQRGRTRPSP